MIRAVISAAAAALTLSACASQPVQTAASLAPTALPTFTSTTESQKALFGIPSPARPVAVAVYSFTDQTGQFRPSSTGQTLSRAVTQGSTSILMKALQDAGRRSWFTIIEREQLAHLLNERQIIREMRERYLGETTLNAEALPSLLFAGVILEGGVIGYDSNTMTGGAGAGFLGISARSEYRQDTVTVYLRAVSVRTGEVLTTVTAAKTIASYSVGGGAFRYVGFKELLEAEAGLTTDEPDQVALQQAIEKAVYALVMEGVELKLWNFADTAAGWPQFWRYQQERDGLLSAEQAAAANARVQHAQALAEAAPVQSRPRLAGLNGGENMAGVLQANTTSGGSVPVGNTTANGVASLSAPARASNTGSSGHQ
jgi:curli production assembly/transport component CsgG